MGVLQRNFYYFLSPEILPKKSWSVGMHRRACIGERIPQGDCVAVARNDRGCPRWRVGFLYFTVDKPNCTTGYP